MAREETRISGLDSILPAPYLSEEFRHIHLLALHVDHPGVIQHPPGGCAARGFFFETVKDNNPSALTVFRQ